MEPAGSFEATPTRRTVLARGAMGVGAAWVAPAVITVPAAAQTGSPDSLRFLASFGELGSGPGQFRFPASVTTRNGYTFVADTENHRIQLIDVVVDQLGFDGEFGQFGTGEADLDRPVGIAFDAQGRVLVVDLGNNRVKVFTSWGAHVLSIGFDDPSAPDQIGQFEFPRGVAGDNDGRILVTEASSNHRIQFFTSTGDFETNLGGIGQDVFGWPSGVTVDANDRIYVADRGYQRIRMFDRNGPLIDFVGNIDLGFHCWDVAVDSGGNMFVCDPDNHRIVVVDPAGNVVHILGEFGAGDGQFNGPEGVAVDSAQRIHVADTGNHRIQVFSPL